MVRSMVQASKPLGGLDSLTRDTVANAALT